MITKASLKRLQSMFSPKQFECVYGLATGLSLKDIATSLDTTSSNASATIAGIAKKLNIAVSPDKSVIEQVREWVKDYIKNCEQPQVYDMDLSKEKTDLPVCEAVKENTETKEPSKNLASEAEIKTGQTILCTNVRYCIDIIKAEADKAYLSLGKAVVLNSYSADAALDTSSMIEKIKRYRVSLEVLEEIGKIKI